MIIVYDSLTGQGKRFAAKLGLDMHDIFNFSDPNPDQQILLITRSFNFGEVPITTEEFLDDFKDRVIGVAVSGNRNWGTNYGAAGDKIQAAYQIPLVLKFEGSGLSKDVQFVKDWIKKQVNQ